MITNANNAIKKQVLTARQKPRGIEMETGIVKNEGYRYIFQLLLSGCVFIVFFHGLALTVPLGVIVKIHKDGD